MQGEVVEEAKATAKMITDSSLEDYNALSLGFADWQIKEASVQGSSTAVMYVVFQPLLR
jgi:hypothetical protein